MNKKKITSLSLSLALTAGLFSGITAQAEQYYPDVDEGHWAYEWVGYMHEHEYIHGYPDGNYRPAQNITRAEYVTILNYIFNSNSTTNKNYVDVNEGDWYYNQIHSAVAAGYLHGYNDATDTNDGTMKPNNFITREEAAVIVACAYGLKLNSDVSKFADSDQISSWAVPYVGALSGDNLLMGDADTSNFRPKDLMLRAEVASLIAQAEINRDQLTYDEIVTLPSSLKEADSAYILDGIITKNIPVEKTLSVAVDAAQAGDVSAYKVTAAIDGVIFADGVTLEGLQNALKEKTFTAEELQKLSISFSGFENPADGSSLTITVKVTDSATGEKEYDSKEYIISFGEQSIKWPANITKNSNTSHSISNVETNYAKDMLLDISEKVNGSVSYTLDAVIGGTELAKGVTLDELKNILAERKLSADDLKSLVITINADNPTNNSSLELTFKLLDAETNEAVGVEKTYTITYNIGGGGSLSGGSGSTVSYTITFETDGGSAVASQSVRRNSTVTEPAAPTKENYIFAGWYTDEALTEKYDFSKAVTGAFTLYAKWEKAEDARDRVVEALNYYQGNDKTSIEENINADKDTWSKDMLMIVLTNDGLNKFDRAVLQTKDAEAYNTVFNSLKSSLGDKGDYYTNLKPVYEDVIDAVIADTALGYKTVSIPLDNLTVGTEAKEKYVLLFRAMVATINGAADSAITVYNDPNNAGKLAAEKFELFKNSAINNTTSVLNNALNGSNVTFETDEKMNIVKAATAYVNALFTANKGNETLKEDLANAGTLNITNFSEIIKKYI